MILITRPLNEAKLLEQELKRFNVKTFIEPLTSFRFLKKKIIFSNKKIFIVTSLQSVHALRKYRNNYQQIISNGSFVVVGMKVAKELRSLGVKKIIRIFNTSSYLLKYLSRPRFKENKMEYLCGSIVSKVFINGLKKNKINYQKKIIYKTIAKKQLSKKCLNLLRNKKIKIVLIYSEYSARLFSNFIKCNNLNEVLSGVKIICLSKRISDAIQKMTSYEEVIWSKSPNQNSMILKISSTVLKSKV
jgi:uroporphyrinogen-III synthase